MDRLEAMRILVAAVEAGSLSAAGRKLAVPLPTVSRKVAELEAHLKTRLFVRSSRRLALTDAGQAYIAACRRILGDVEEAERAATGEYQAPKGELIVTAPVAFGRLHLLPIVNAFLKAYPEIDIRLVLADRIVDLMADQVDVALRIGDLPDSSLVAQRIGAVHRMVLASPAYLAARGTPQMPDDLRGHDGICFEGWAAPEVWTFRIGGKEEAVPIHARLGVTTTEAAVDAAVAGIGLARVISYQGTAAVRAGALVPVLRAFEPREIPVHLLHRADRLLPLKLRAFLDFAAPRLRQTLADIAAQMGQRQAMPRGRVTNA